MLFSIADVIDIGKNIEAVHQKYILKISQHKYKIELLSSWNWEISFVSKHSYKDISTEIKKKCKPIAIILWFSWNGNLIMKYKIPALIS